MRMRFLAASFAVLITNAIAAAAPAPALMKPTGPWHVEYAGSVCLLGRPYGPARLIIKPSMIGDKLEIIVATARTRFSPRVTGQASLAIAGQAVAGESYFHAYSSAKSRILRVGSDEETLTLSALHDTLSIDAARESRHLFALAGIERARPALNTCLDKLRSMYSVTKADLAPIMTEPQASVRKFFSSSDYPIEALRNNQSGIVGVLLWIETDGGVSTCEVIEPIDVPILQQTTCNIFRRRGRFTPAKDAAGKAIRAPMTARIKWQLPS